MIKRTKSIDLDQQEGQVNQINNTSINKGISKDNILEHEHQDQVHELPKSIGLRQIKMTQTSPMPNGRQSRVVPTRYANNTKLPLPIYESIVKLASGKKTIQSMTTSKMARAIFSKARELKGNSFICDICACEYEETDKKKIAKCSHAFCDSCLRHYVDYKISRFEEVSCPSENCPEIMDMEGQFYKSLTDQLKQKYKKVHAFSMVSKNPNSRLCPDQKCKQGFVNIEEGVEPKCNKCNKIYCAKCMFPAHSGPCQNNEIDFFQNNLHFRQCSNCKAVVEKVVGCNHITCRCGYHFCYLCGGKWLNYQHRCGTNAQGRAEPPANQRCCQCVQGDNCCASFGRVLIKIMLFPVFLLLLTIFLAQTLVVFVGALFLAILMGLFPYTFQFICECDCPWVLILILLYPLAMFVGLAKCFADFFCTAVGNIFQFFCENVANVAECLFGW